jgi:glucan phosphoethanolaminetransferase (alkaline phosphatase superfamily)
MRALSLLAVFLLAKAAVVSPAGWLGSPWAPLAFVWQDVVVFAAFAALEGTLARAHLAWPVYGLAVISVAVSTGVARVLSTPLTLTLLRAARPELGDSIGHFMTPETLAWPALVLLAGALLPVALRRVPPPRGTAGAAGLALAAAALGPLASRRVDTEGFDRNVLLALPMSAWPRVAAQPASEPWRSSPFAPPRAAPLTRLRGSAAGRNAVLVVLESAGAQYLGAYGARPDPMPHVAELARRGLVVESAYAVYPESVKGLVSVLSSQYTALDTEAERYADPRVPSIAHVLAEAGYDTALFHSGRFMYLGMDAVVGGCGFATLEDAGAIGGRHDSSFGIDEASTVARILGWIEGRPRSRPFFVVYLPIAGHHPYATHEPGPFPEDSEIGRYRNALHEADAALGSLRRGLRDRGLDGSTVWMVVGDHGEAFGQHAGNFGHTLFIHEENVRVPFVVGLPGLMEDTARIAGPASLLDVAPTVLDLLGRPVPLGYEGRSVVSQPPGMALFYTDYSLGWLGLRDGCLKLVHGVESGRSRLFDVCVDPRESRDLSPAFPEQTAFYRRRLERWSAAQKALVDQ